MTIKILKNTTSTSTFLSDVGISVAANSAYTIPSQDFLLWIDAVDFMPYVEAGSLVVNNGTADLPPSDGIDWIKTLSATSTSKNFSYKSVSASSILVIPSDQQMSIFGDISVSGDIELYGELVLRNY